MSSGSSIPYHLRLNKAVEREIFLGLLTALSPCLDLREYRYIGMGGPFLEDYRALHARLGIRDMVCVEMDVNTHRRQQFNAPVGGIHFELSSIEEYLKRTQIDEKPSIVWLDYTSADSLREQFETFLELVSAVAPRSIVKLTLNANATSLDSKEPVTGDAMFEARLTALQGVLGDLLAADASPKEITYRGYGQLLVRSLGYALEDRLEGTGVRFLGVGSFRYSDGQPMVTVTGISLDEDDVVSFIQETQVTRWPFYREAWPVVQTIDLPVLSTKERLELQRAMNTGGEPDLEFSLPVGRLLRNSKEMLESFATYYRMTPSFAKVEV